jgi:hypothetical protein
MDRVLSPVDRMPAHIDYAQISLRMSNIRYWVYRQAC